MPSVPANKIKATKAKKSAGSERPARSAGSDQGQRSAPPPTGRAAGSLQQVKADLSSTYRMAGIAMRPFSRFYPALDGIGVQMVALSDEAAQAWVEVAEKDPRVRDALISLTKASVWGNLIGIHFAIFASAAPGLSGAIPQQPQEAQSGMSPQEEQLARQMAASMAASMAGENGDMPAQDHAAAGGPGDTIRVGGQPVQQPMPQQAPVEQAPQPGSRAPKSKIMTPEELGVAAGQGHATPFPAGENAQ